MALLAHDQWFDTLGWEPDAQIQGQLDAFYAQVLAGNQQQNLTRITDPQEFWEKHLWDSLRSLWPYRGLEDQLVIDIGSGAGLPGIPVAILKPQWYVALLEATRKKASFLSRCTQSLGLTNVQVIPDRAEVVGHQKKHREGYDLALIRAVAPVTVCAEYALPLLKVGGTALLYRGHWEIREEVELGRALMALGGEIREIDAFQLPFSAAVRHCIAVTKNQPTHRAFPREDGLPARHPLGVIEETAKVDP